MDTEAQPESNLLLERAWHARERLYLELFGPESFRIPKENKMPADPETALASGPAELAALCGKSLKLSDISIQAFAPNELRPFWIYASSGLSNPWFGQNEEVSGFGCELVLKTKTPGRWAFRLLRRLVYYLISYSGTLKPGVMMQFDAPLFSQGKSELGGIAVWYLDEAPDAVYELPSGQFAIFSVIGITNKECEFVETVDEYGSWCIQQIIRDAGYQQCTEPARPCLMNSVNVQEKIASLRNYLENFGFQGGQL